MSKIKILSSKGTVLTALGLLVVLAVLHTPIIWVDIFVYTDNDYHAHISFAESLEQGLEIPDFTRAHPFWQYAVIALHQLPFLSLNISAFLIQLAANLLLGLVLFELLLENKLNQLASALLVIVLTIVTPVFLLVPKDGQYYLGYIGITTYHNPTIILLKPFAAFLYIYATRIFKADESSRITVIITAVIVVVSTLIKPNFIICLLPVLGIFSLYSIFRHRIVQWRLMITGIVIPAVLVLAWQFYVTYTLSASSVAFAPLAVMGYYSSDLFVKFILSIWFPLVVSILYFQQLRRDYQMGLAWLIFLAGALYTYLLAEVGSRFPDGNFVWSGEIANFILFVAATLFVSRQIVPGYSKTKVSTSLVFGLAPHGIAGVIYWVLSLNR